MCDCLTEGFNYSFNNLFVVLDDRCMVFVLLFLLCRIFHNLKNPNEVLKSSENYKLGCLIVRIGIRL